RPARVRGEKEIQRSQAVERQVNGTFADFWQPLFEAGDMVVLDGALATELERRGANLDDPLWSAKVLIDDPDLIRAVHLDYLRAGADVITSSSYQASF